MKMATAQNIAQKSIKILIKCQKCNSINNLVRHHFDYNKPEEVIILCEKCHKKWHKNNKSLNREELIKLMISFVGKKAELHTQLKKWCEESDRTMNGRIIELIEQSLKNK